MSPTSDVVVVGGGFAGLSAAVRLAQGGVRVLVAEARRTPGGRATVVRDPVGGEMIDNGQHLLLGCYRETFAFLRTIGAESNVRIQPALEVTFIDGDGRITVLACPVLPSPLHLLGGVIGWDALSFRDRLSILSIAPALRLAREEARGGRLVAASPGETVENWLIRNGQRARVREMLWDPLAVAALNQSPAEAAAPTFAHVLARMFGSDPRDSAIGTPGCNLDEMYVVPAVRFIEARGGQVLVGKRATVDVADNAIVSVTFAGQEIRPAAVVVAVPWFALADTVRTNHRGLSGVLDHAARTRSCPIVTVNVWLDQPLLDAPFVGLPGRAFQWVFDKGRTRDGAWRLSMVASGADALVAGSNDELAACAIDELFRALGARAASATVIRWLVVREKQATFSLAPDQPERPRADTPVPGLIFAGDWTDTGLPATIEGAVTSGHRAADLVLQQLGPSTGT